VGGLEWWDSCEVRDLGSSWYGNALNCFGPLKRSFERFFAARAFTVLFPTSSATREQWSDDDDDVNWIRVLRIVTKEK
jgi:hypothetical protein